MGSMYTEETNRFHLSLTSYKGNDGSTTADICEEAARYDDC